MNNVDPTGLEVYYTTAMRGGVKYIQKRDDGGYFGRDFLIKETRAVNSGVGTITGNEGGWEYFGRKTATWAKESGEGVAILSKAAVDVTVKVHTAGLVDTGLGDDLSSARKVIHDGMVDRYTQSFIEDDSYFNNLSLAVHDVAGGTNLSEAGYGVDIISGEKLDTTERWSRGLIGTGKVLNTAAIVSGIPGTQATISTQLNAAGGSVRGAIASEAQQLFKHLTTLERRNVPQVRVNQQVGDSASDAIAARYPGARREVTYQTTDGPRRLDVLTRRGAAIESKVGRTSLTRAARRQVMKDVELMNDPAVPVSSYTWEFSPSPTTGLVGPTRSLEQLLQQNGIGIVINPTFPVAPGPALPTPNWLPLLYPAGSAASSQ